MDHCIQHFSNLKIHNNKGFCYKSESKFCLALSVCAVCGWGGGGHTFCGSRKGRVMVYLAADRLGNGKITR